MTARLSNVSRGGYDETVAVYHITLHAYRSWSPVHPRGYAIRGKGIKMAILADGQ
jgi:hypothetical protein